MKQTHSLGTPPMIVGDLSKRQRTPYKLMCVARPMTEEAEVYEEDRVVKAVCLKERVAWPELGPYGINGIWKVQGAVYHVDLFHKVDFQKLFHELKLTHGEIL